MDRLLVICVLLYCMMTAITHGYVMDRHDCYINPSQFGEVCDAGPIFAATFWPVYWIYHSGTLLFEPSNTDN